MPEEENLKKLIFKSQYVIEEYEETKEKMDMYLQQLYKDFPDEYNAMMGARKSKEENSEGSQGEGEIQEEEEEEIHETDENKKPPSMRKLYRRISKITHPDKIDSEFLNEYFKKASSAYAENNVSELFTIASFLNIDTSDINKDEIIKDLKDDMFSKQFMIANLKSSIAWQWAHAKTEEEKDKIREVIKKYAEKNY